MKFHSLLCILYRTLNSTRNAQALNRCTLQFLKSVPLTLSIHVVSAEPEPVTGLDRDNTESDLGQLGEFILLILFLMTNKTS